MKANVEREFAATSYSETLFDNANRMLDTIAPLTVSAYEKRWRTFVNAQSDIKGLKNKLYAIVRAVIDKANNQEVTWNSIRLYKATVCYGITMTYLAKFHATTSVYSELRGIANFTPEKGLLFDNAIDKAYLESIYDEIKDFTQPKESNSTSGLITKSTAKTSSTKDKKIDDDIYELLLGDVDVMSSNYDIIKLFIRLNCVVGLRPVEWFSMQAMSRHDFENNDHLWFDKLSNQDLELVAEKTRRVGRNEVYAGLSDMGENSSVVLVKNSKNSLGRAGIDYRAIYVSDPKFYEEAQRLQSMIIQLAQDVADLKKSKGDDSHLDDKGLANVLAFTQIMATLQRTMRRVIDNNDSIQTALQRKHKAKIRKKNHQRKLKGLPKLTEEELPPMKVPTLYSTRHQAVANAKESGMSSVAIAAMFGHSSVVTAKRHYGKGASGSGRTQVRPANRNIQNVVLGLTEQQIETLLTNSLDNLKGVKNTVTTSKPSRPSSLGFDI